MAALGGDHVVTDREARTQPGLVLIHGGYHTARCWAPTVDELERQAPDVAVLAVDLPGRGSSPADLGSVTLASCVERVVELIEAAGLDVVVVVGHSLGGLTATAVAARLGANRVAGLVSIATIVPPEGASTVQAIPWAPARWFISRLNRSGRARRPPSRALARLAFCNGMSQEQRELVYGQLCPEATNLFNEPAVRTGLPASVPHTWILTLRDRACPARYQRTYIRRLSRIDDVIEVDTCHDVMISRPATLAELLAERCRPGWAARISTGR